MSDEQERDPIVTEWGGLPNYECPVTLPDGSRCQFATLDRDQFDAHIDVRWGPHKVEDSAPAVVQPISDDERGELLALREENASLKRELTSTKGQLTKAKNQLGVVGEQGQDAVVLPDDAASDDAERDGEGA